MKRTLLLTTIVGALLALNGAPASAAASKYLGRPLAEKISRKTIADKYPSWYARAGSSTKCPKRINRTRLRCYVNWSSGDTSYLSSLRARTLPNNQMVIAGRTTVFNDYCIYVTHPESPEQCIGHHKLGPVIWRITYY